MKIAILGIGSIGSFVAATFSQHTNHDLYLLARSNYSEIKHHGIAIEEAGDRESWKAYRYTVVNDIHAIPVCDVIILTVKESQLPDLLPHLEGVCHSKTKIVSLQNGIGFERKIQNFIPSHPLYSGTCWIKVTPLALGHIRHDFGKKIKLGKYSLNNQVVPLQSSDKKIQKLFEQAKFECDLEDNIHSIQLTKLALNVPFFALIAREGKTASEILSDHLLNNQREELQNEIVEATIKCGSPIDMNFLKETIENLRKMPVSIPPSREKLAQTMKAELPSNVGALLNFMKSKNLQLNKLQNLYDQLFVQTENVQMQEERRD